MMNSRSRSEIQKKSKQRKRKKVQRVAVLLLVSGVIAIGAIIWIAKLDFNPFSHFGKNSDKSVNSLPTEQLGTSPSSSEETSTTNEPNDATTAPEETIAPEESITPSEETANTITLALVGDILPAANVLTLMNANGFDYPFREVKAILESADITAGNLETPITTRGTAAKDKQYVYRAPPEVVPSLIEAGFDFLSLANNHTLDYGWEGLNDTMDYLDAAGLKFAGSGFDDKAAFAPRYMESNGFDISFVSLTRVVPDISWKADRLNPGVAEAYSTERAVAAIKEAKSNSDIVVVMVHWGKEGTDTPDEFQKYLAYSFVDAGADLVIGSHPHMLQGFEYYKDKWIAYSLGNFVFPGMSPATTAETGVLSAVCKKDGSCSLAFQPMLAKLAQPVPMDAETGKALFARLSGLSINATVQEDGSIVED